VLQGKVGGAFASSATQHGGQETTRFTITTNLLHFGMTVVGLNYGFAGQADAASALPRSDRIVQPCGRRTTVITRGYRLHGVTSFPIRRMELHALTVPCSSGAQPPSVLCRTTLLSPADGENPPWSLAVSQAANPGQNYRTGFPRDSTSSTISRCFRPDPRRGSIPRTGLSR
jgi:multimeric flavodoxin WrbA